MTSPQGTDIPARLEKLKFMVEEMQVASYLATHLTESSVARTLARHILIRAENFIEHARGLRKPLKDAGYATRDFHKTKEAYASNFEEYFKVARHRLGAHVQDLDFGTRIELWNDIETVKISYFVDGARQIYQDLATLRVPGYVACAEPLDLADPVLADTLRQLQRAIDSRNWVEMGTDSLALTRSNTAGTLNTSPIHARAGQLALIRRWITLQRDLLNKLVAYPRIAQILKARILTDIVSFCDCLVTRPVQPGAPQQMDGLDDLLKAEGQTSAPIDNFVAASNFNAELQAARAVRDRLGGHLEADPAHTLASLLADLAAYDLNDGLRFYERVAAAFIKNCHAVLFLRMYAADGSRLYGVISGQNRAVPYAGESTIDTSVPPAPPALPAINDEEAYRNTLIRWLDGDEAQKGNARQFFWNAFMGSDVIEVIDDAGRRHELRRAHQFLGSILAERSDQDFTAVLQLMIACRGGAPYPLAELLVRHGRDASPFRQWLICFTLGEVSSDRHGSAIEFLQACARSPSWPIRLRATLARFKMFLKTEGIFRTNHQGRTEQDYDQLVQMLLQSMSEQERLVCLLGFASIQSGPFAAFSRPFESNYAALQSQIETLCLPFLKDSSQATTLGHLIRTHDYVGVCVLVAIHLKGGDRNLLYAALLDNSCKNNITTARHDQALRHLAMCFHMMKDDRTALQIAEDVASRNPEWVDVQVLVVQILGEIPSEEDKAALKAAEVRRSYKLDTDQERRITAVETEIAKRKQSS